MPKNLYPNFTRITRANLDLFRSDYVTILFLQSRLSSSSPFRLYYLHFGTSSFSVLSQNTAHYHSYSASCSFSLPSLSSAGPPLIPSCISLLRHASTIRCRDFCRQCHLPPLLRLLAQYHINDVQPPVHLHKLSPHLFHPHHTWNTNSHVPRRLGTKGEILSHTNLLAV